MYDLLKGVRIVDLSSVVLGPYATLLLADMGAEVIKVEPLEGDIFRAARPGKPGGDGAGFLNINRNKKSIALDLRQPDDRALLDRLITTADVFVHNMRHAPCSSSRADCQRADSRTVSIATNVEVLATCGKLDIFSPSTQR